MENRENRGSCREIRVGNGNKIYPNGTEIENIITARLIVELPWIRLTE